MERENQELPLKNEVEIAGVVMKDYFPDFGHVLLVQSERGDVCVFYQKLDKTGRASAWMITFGDNNLFHLQFGKVREKEGTVDTSYFGTQRTMTVPPSLDPQNPLNISACWFYQEGELKNSLEKALSLARSLYDEKWEGEITEIFHQDYPDGPTTVKAMFARISLKGGGEIMKPFVEGWRVGDRLKKTKGQIRVSTRR